MIVTICHPRKSQNGEKLGADALDDNHATYPSGRYEVILTKFAGLECAKSQGSQDCRKCGHVQYKKQL